MTLSSSETAAKPLYEWTVPGAGMWSKVIGRGKTLRLTDVEGGVNCAMLLYNALEKQERYNMPDTLKGQHIFYLTAPYCLHSDMGRLLASMTKDTVGWHDTVCGTSDKAGLEKGYGLRTYQQARNECFKNGRECFLIELGKWGLGERDLVPNVNFFSKVAPDESGRLSFAQGFSAAGAVVELRMEMDTLVVLHTCPHPLDPNPVWAPKPLKLEVFSTMPVDEASDPSLNIREENRRAFENTSAYHTLRF